MTDILIFSVAFACLAVINLMILFSIFSGRGVYLDIAIISALLGIIDTMLVGRYLQGRRK